MLLIVSRGSHDRVTTNDIGMLSVAVHILLLVGLILGLGVRPRGPHAMLAVYGASLVTATVWVVTYMTYMAYTEYDSAWTIAIFFPRAIPFAILLATPTMSLVRAIHWTRDHYTSS
jgi:hypothetical protein